MSVSINLNRLYFAHPKPVTDSKNATVKHKTPLHISIDCHLYPTVQECGFGRTRV